MTRAATASPPRRSPPADRRMLMTRRLLESVEELLAEGHAFADLSVEQIIGRANIARSTFYAYFSDKGGLLAEIGGEAVTSVILASRDWSRLPAGAGRDDLRRIFAGLFATYREHAEVMAAMAEAAAYDQAVRAQFQRLLTVGHRELTEHVRARQAEGAACRDLDPPTVVSYLVSMVERVLYQHVRRCPPDELPRHVDTLATVVWRTLYAPAGGSA